MLKIIRRHKKHRYASWQDIKTRYITSDAVIQFRELSKQIGIHFTVISRRAKREKWAELRAKHWNKISNKVQRKAVNLAVLERSEALIKVNSLIEKTLKEIDTHRYEIDKLSSLIGAIDKLIRLNEFLQGNPDSRPEDGNSGDMVELLNKYKEYKRQRFAEYQRLKDSDPRLTLPPLREEAQKEMEMLDAELGQDKKTDE